MKKNKNVNLKEQKGAATALVIFTVLIFMAVLMGTYGIIMSKAQAQIKSDERIQQIYGSQVDRADRIYNEIVDDYITNMN